MDRTINWGDDAADARYRTQDTSSTGGDFVLAEDLDGGTVLLEYDYSASEWVSRGPVNLSGNDITNAGSITADSLEAETVALTPEDSGTVTISANGRVSLVTKSDLSKTYFLALVGNGDSNDNGSVEKIFSQDGSGNTRYILNETSGTDWSGEWELYSL